MLKSEFELLKEGKLTNMLATAGLAAGIANANVGIKPVHGLDVKYGDTTKTLFHQRHSHKLDANEFDYRLDSLPKLSKNVYDAADIHHIKDKILATPDSILSKYGKANADTIAKYVVKAADKYDIDVNILLAILAIETGFNQNAVSHTGVRGIGQITGPTLISLQAKGKIDKSHTLEGVRTDVRKAIYATADIVNYYSTHMHDNIEMIFAEYNGGMLGGASPYRMHRQGKSRKEIDKWLTGNKCSKNTISHFHDETLPYVQKCMRMYKYYLNLDNTND